jgi:hypothetical protein
VRGHAAQSFVSQHLAARPRPRRRFVPPSPSVPVSQSVNQRWRERPRCPAVRVTPGRRDGVVHAIVGRVARRCLCAQVVREERAARVHVFESTFAGRIRLTSRTEICSGRSNMFPAEASRLQTRSRRRAIALLMLAPCSVSSMLFAALRPGRRPGLRALTTPPRGTSRAPTRWRSACRSRRRG